MNALARTPDRKTLTLLLLIAILFALVPRAFTEALEIPKAPSWIGLADLAVLVVTHRLGWRQQPRQQLYPGRLVSAARAGRQRTARVGSW